MQFINAHNGQERLNLRQKS